MRSFLISLVGLALSSAPAGHAAEIHDDYMAALDKSDYEAAAKSYSRMLDSRVPADGVPRRDALLNALGGLALLHTEGVEEAALYLANAPISELPASLRFPTAMALGRAKELLGLRLEARDAYRAALALPVDPASRETATIALARQLLVDDPVAARQLLTPLDRGTATADWEIPALLAVIEGIAGDKERQSDYVDRAWALASRAKAGSDAIQKVAVIQAGIAAVAGDRARVLSMLAAANAQDAILSDGITMNLPICGENGVSEADFMIVGAVDGPAGQRLLPLAASRQQIIATFHDHLARAKLLSGRLGGGAAGSIATVRCTPFVTTGHTHGSGNLPPFVGWLIEKGLPMDLEGRFGDGGILRYSHRIEQLTSRFGSDSPLLIEPRMSLASRLQSALLAGEAVLPGQVTDLMEQVIAAVRRLGAPETYSKDLEQGLRFFRLTQKPIDADTVGATLDIASARAALNEPGIAKRGLAIAYRTADERSRTAVARSILENRDRITKALTGIEQASWLRLVAAAQFDLGDESGSMRTLASAGVPADSCPAMNEAPRLLEQNFSPNDFPGDAKDQMFTGRTAFYMDVQPSGRIARPRVVVAFPSLIFDEVADQGVASIVYSPPRKGGKAVPCRGTYQTVRWILPTEGDFVDPWANTPEVEGEAPPPVD